MIQKNTYTLRNFTSQKGTFEKSNELQKKLNIITCKNRRKWKPFGNEITLRAAAELLNALVPDVH